MKLKKILCLMTSAVMMIAGTSCGNKIEDIDVSSFVEQTSQTVQTTTSPPPENPVVSIAVTGDNLIHSSIYNQAYARGGYEYYDFEYAYENIKSLINCDLNIINQETLICNDEYEPSDYPQFNSPVDLGNYLIDIGFNVFSTSNNHVIDKGEDGLRACLDYWNGQSSQRGVIQYGAYYNDEDMQNIRTTEVNGIKFAFVAFTEYTNGLTLPQSSPLRIIYTSETDTMKSQIEAAAAISDFVIVSVHWGLEDTDVVDDARRNLAQQFADWGADLIIGNHSHVLQSMEYISASDGRKVFVYYSLGNLISAQSDNFNLVSAISHLNVTKDLETGQTDISDVIVDPIVTHYGYGYSDVKLYKFSEYSDELAAQHGIHTASSGNYHDFSMETIEKMLIKNVPAEFLNIG